MGDGKPILCLDYQHWTFTESFIKKNSSLCRARNEKSRYSQMMIPIAKPFLGRSLILDH
jgi:hypothetical protein